MRKILDRYVRSLKEREEDPERYQDVGTLVTWILEQHGYTLLARPYKHKGVELRVSKGRLQHGIDILAAKEEAGKVTSYRFVLKAGPFGKAQYTPDVEGTMMHDLELAASLQPKAHESRYDIEPDAVVVVAVHNGTLDQDQVGANVAGFRSRLETRNPWISTDWWDADRLVTLILEARASGTQEPFLRSPEASIFPPSTRPFINLALLSLLPARGKAGSGFDPDAVDRLLDERLPVNRGDATSPKPEDTRRAIAELSLFLAMVEAECGRIAEDTTLPVFDALERVLCRSIEHVRRVHATSRPSKPLREAIYGLLDLYAVTAAGLLARLTPVLEIPYGLALVGRGEVINYPLRALRLSGYLAIAGLAKLLDGSRSSSPDSRHADAEQIGSRLVRLWEQNEGGCLSPVTDDQLIEIGLVWELWLRLGILKPVAWSARQLIQRLALRKAAGLPLPSLWHRARIPMRNEDLQALVEAHARGRTSAPSSFTDEGSTLLPLALYLAVRLGAPPEASEVQAFLPAKSADDERAWTVVPEVWQPPEDASSTWYTEGIERQGTCKVLTWTTDLEAFAAAFEASCHPLPRSRAEELGFGVVDRMAWKLWRTPASMALFVELVQRCIREAPPRKHRTASK